jgi:N-formylglutamate deformylase
MVEADFVETTGPGPLIATAIHDGHSIRDDLRPLIALTEAERLREEDPFTRRWVTICPSSIVAKNSRFQVDLNRPREASVYRTPQEAWGLMVYERPLSDAQLARAFAEHDAFYARLAQICDAKVERHGGFVLFDLHSYNHQRKGPDQPEAPWLCPEVNLGTGSVPAARSREPIERWLAALREATVDGRRLDVRENVKFRGGYLSRWVHQRYPATGLALAIEVKKFFMDEWTGTPDDELIEQLKNALRDAALAIEGALFRP